MLKALRFPLFVGLCVGVIAGIIVDASLAAYGGGIAAGLGGIVVLALIWARA